MNILTTYCKEDSSYTNFRKEKAHNKQKNIQKHRFLFHKKHVCNFKDEQGTLTEINHKVRHCNIFMSCKRLYFIAFLPSVLTKSMRNSI